MSFSGPSNAAVLSRESQVWAAKKRAKAGQVKEIKFDESSRREYLTGFRKRNLAKQAAGKAKAIEREKALKLEERKERREELKARARDNRIAVEQAHGNELNGGADELPGLGPSSSKGKEKQRDDQEFEDEDIVATVTVVEDLDLGNLDDSGPSLEAQPGRNDQGPVDTAREKGAPPSTKPKRPKETAAQPQTKKKKHLSYETKGERLQRKREEKAKRVKLAITRNEDGTAERRRLKKMKMRSKQGGRNAGNRNKS